jgi:hypothetical protein
MYSLLSLLSVSLFASNLPANKLTLNKDKSEYMLIGSRQRISNLVTAPKIELGESVIKKAHKPKTFGIIIDEHILWN